MSTEAKIGGSKWFLFEKRNHKTFNPWAGRPRLRRSQNDQQFFASFFQKRRPFFRLPLFPPESQGSYTKEAKNF
jgi:hypothetical protein